MLEAKLKTRVCWWIGLGLVFLSAQEAKAQTYSASTGIEGVVSVGPAHGGPSRAGVSDSAPLANMAFEATNDAGAATSFTTDALGRFKVLLAPGRYSIKRQDQKAKFPRCGPWEVEVTAGGFKQLQWNCDSGMR
jgi:hypothetical protein